MFAQIEYHSTCQSYSQSLAGSTAAPSAKRSDADAPTAAVLSARELQVVGLLRTGLTLEQIGERLFISRDTVKTHASRSYKKLGAHGRDAAVAEAERLGIL